MLPCSTIAAESLGENTTCRTPCVEGDGTGVELKSVCKGVGEDHSEIATVSRKIKAQELTACRKAGMLNIMEVRID